MASKDVSVQEVCAKLIKGMGEGKAGMASKTNESVLVKPENNEEVIHILKIAESYGIPVMPKNLWISRVDTTDPYQIIMDTSAMKDIFKIDEENLAATVGPGVLWKNLNASLSEKNLSLGVFPSVAISQVGDWIDIGGAGIGSYSHGFAIDQVRTMEVVLPNGKVINTGFDHVLSNSSGYNLNGLFVGSYSTMGIITRITLKLFPKPQVVRPMFYTFSDTKSMCRALHALTRAKATPLNISFYGQNHFTFIKHIGEKEKNPSAPTVNITLAGVTAGVQHDEDRISVLMKNNGAEKENGGTAGRLWSRQLIDLESKTAKLVPVFGEVLVPISNLTKMLDDTYAIFKKMQLNGEVMGTLCDRSTILFTPYFLVKQGDLRKSGPQILFSRKLGALAFKYGGRPSGLSLVLGKKTKQAYGNGLKTILDIKSAIDPHNIMNPRGIT